MAGAAACFLVVVSVSFSQLLVCEAVVEKRPRHHAWSQAGEGKDGGGMRIWDPRNSSVFVQQLLEKSDGQLSNSSTPLAPPPSPSSDWLSWSSPFLSTSSPSFSFTSYFSSSSLASSRLLMSRRLRPALEAEQEFPGDDPSLGRLLVDVVRREMRGCSLVLVANGGYEASLALQEVLRLPNFRQVGRGRPWRSPPLAVIIKTQSDV